MEQVTAEKTENRKVREDFDPTSSYRVDVVGCTEEVKSKVQQAFFDVGLQWGYWGKKYKYLNAAQYSNTTSSGDITEHLLYGSTAERSNMSAEEFLALVYEPGHQGHVHHELMAQYAEDAKTHAEPWKLWECKALTGDWLECISNPLWVKNKEYRRKPKTKLIHGVEIPDLRTKPKIGRWYWYPDVSVEGLVSRDVFTLFSPSCNHRIANNLCYEYSDEGREAAIMHSMAWLGI